MISRSLPRELYDAEGVRALDRCAITEFGIPGITLMERAGQAAFGMIQRRWPKAQRIVVFCGAGNNGGDGYMVANLAQRAGKHVQVFHVGDRQALCGDAATAMQQAQAAQVPMCNALDPGVTLDAPADLIVDALLGTGLKGNVRADYLGPIEAINAGAAPVLAVDIPSGLSADTGMQLGSAVRADATVTFIGLKQGLFTGRGPALCGDIHFDDLMVPRDVYERVRPTAERLDTALLDEVLRPRDRDAHKGRFGHVLVVGGDEGCGGAVIMAAEAAARVGAGLVSVATRADHVTPSLVRRPEIMAHAIRHAAELEPLLARATVVVVGPGLGQSNWSRSLLVRVLATDLPLVIDADALNLLAAARVAVPPHRRQQPDWVLTPHPGEAGRLIGVDGAAVHSDRFAVTRAIHAHLGGTILLKGAGTLIDDGGVWPVAIATVGNPGMASGGMGDVLAGVIGGFIAQGWSPPLAARLGVVAHGAAADRSAALHGERGMLATDLMCHLHDLVNGKGENDFPVR